MVVEPFDAARTPKFATQIAELRHALETMFDRIAAGEDILEQLERISVLHREVQHQLPRKCSVITWSVKVTRRH